MAAQLAEAKTRVDRQVAVADAIEGDRQLYRAQITDVAMRRLDHYNKCDSIRKEKVLVQELKGQRQKARDRIVQLKRLMGVAETSLEKIQGVIANDEFLFEPQRVNPLHYRTREEVVEA